MQEARNLVFSPNSIGCKNNYYGQITDLATGRSMSQGAVFLFAVHAGLKKFKGFMTDSGASETAMGTACKHALSGNPAIPPNL